MRVTKLIKDYVEKTVKEKMPNPEAPVDTLQEEYNALIEGLEAYCRNAVKDFVRKHGGEFYFSFSGYGADEVEKLIAFVDRRCDLHYPSVRSVAAEDYEKLCKETAKKRIATVNEILVSLELGANRAELEEMLSKIG